MNKNKNFNKDINKDPWPFKKILIFIYKKLVRYWLFFAVISLFFVGYKATFYIFANQYVIDNFLKGNGYSETCLTLIEEPDLLRKLDFFYTEAYKSGKHDDKVIPIFFTNFPKGISEVSSSEKKKFLFISIVLPILLKVENEVKQERAKILDLAIRFVEVPLTEKDFIYLENMANKYRIPLKEKNFWNYSLVLDELIKRVDIIPTSLTIAVAAKETGWGGGSRFLFEGNSLFSQYTWSEKLGLRPRERGAGLRHSIRRFSSLEAAVRAYYSNLNTHPSYVSFREVRHKMQVNNQVDPVTLSKELSNYSIENLSYVKDLSSLIATNNLIEYDKPKKFTKHSNLCVKVI